MLYTLHPGGALLRSAHIAHTHSRVHSPCAEAEVGFWHTCDVTPIDPLWRSSPRTLSPARSLPRALSPLTCCLERRTQSRVSRERSCPEHARPREDIFLFFCRTSALCCPRAPSSSERAAGSEEQVLNPEDEEGMEPLTSRR